MPDSLKRQIVLTLYLADHPIFVFKIVNADESMSIWDMSVSLTVGISGHFRIARFSAGLNRLGRLRTPFGTGQEGRMRGFQNRRFQRAPNPTT
jgi:hypothetical protein